MKPIKSALISVYHKDNLDKIVQLLIKNQVKIYSTGGTQTFLESVGATVIPVETLTNYPSILGGRVKTLHPKIFGGILARRDDAQDISQMQQFEIPEIDLVIVDLYPFEATLASGAGEEEIIEKIDIGGISLIRASAKNYKDVAIIASQAQYQELLDMLVDNKNQNNALDMLGDIETQAFGTTLSQRKLLATHAFAVSSHYDTKIFQYFNQQIENTENQDTENDKPAYFRASENHARVLRYGENPHQKGIFYGNFNAYFEQLNGKELSYNNLVDVESAVNLCAEFNDDISNSAFIIIKHTNACGVGIANTSKDAYLRALEADPVSAFGGVIATNKKVDKETALELNKLFFEVLIAPEYDMEGLGTLNSKKNRIILRQKQAIPQLPQFKTLLGGVLMQDGDYNTETAENLKTVTQKQPSETEIQALLFANKICKHTKSNVIILAKPNQLLASGVGQTSRVDALKQAIEKAKTFNFDLKGAVMASDAFFPFPDCVEIAYNAGITAVIQPGGSIKDQDSVDFCDKNNIAMVMTGIRHFKH